MQLKHLVLLKRQKWITLQNCWVHICQRMFKYIVFVTDKYESYYCHSSRKYYWRGAYILLNMKLRLTENSTVNLLLWAVQYQVFISLCALSICLISYFAIYEGACYVKCACTSCYLIYFSNYTSPVFKVKNNKTFTVQYLHKCFNQM